ncbi:MULTISPECIES: EAL domain-containing protein [unclassified Pseudoalteromonas]|uniref:EAL domain-containing protein n=1 Tax=unclassified Pseudoalteromonas TaxID=194690 RepID=UPI0020977549|nr:EAL domain-containing protein [Pseudoalteromonas sp. XMcav2-N]MCO7189332.1 EAL domain-containing protein [Pseudoalteromonas sp. XMcav2-N]
MRRLVKADKEIFTGWGIRAVMGVVWLLVNGALWQFTHAQVVQQAGQLQSHLAQLDASSSAQQVGEFSTLIRHYGFISEDQAAPVWLWATESETFQFAEQTLALSPAPILEDCLPVVLFMNLLILGAGYLFSRWMGGLSRSELSASQARAITSDLAPVPKMKVQAVEESRKVSVFAMVKWRLALPDDLDPQSHFSVTLARCFSKYERCSCKYLSSGALVMTLAPVDKVDVDALARRIHEVVYQALLSFRPDLSRSAVKCGVCFYAKGADQAMVYQVVRSALSIAQSNVWQHVHIMPLNHTLSTSLRRAESEIIDDIKAGRFMLFFQPLFGFAQQDVIQSEALLRVRHRSLGLMSAGQFIHKIHQADHLLMLDKTMVRHALNALSKEPVGFSVSLNLHVLNWSNRDFVAWLSEQVAESGRATDIAFELTLQDFYQHEVYCAQVLTSLSEQGCRFVLDHVNAPVKIEALREFGKITALKLAFELIHEVHHSAKRRSVVRQVVSQAKLLGIPVYAVGVETKEEFECITNLGVDGAQGYYFSAPLLQLEQSL